MKLDSRSMDLLLFMKPLSLFTVEPSLKKSSMNCCKMFLTLEIVLSRQLWMMFSWNLCQNSQTLGSRFL